MSWTLFLQVLILAILICCTAVAIAEKLAPKSVKPTGKTMFYMNVEKPKPPLVGGDMWMNPDTNEVKIWDEKRGDWKEVKA